jgi:hypothetical protein
MIRLMSHWVQLVKSIPLPLHLFHNEVTMLSILAKRKNQRGAPDKFSMNLTSCCWATTSIDPRPWVWALWWYE